MSLSQIKYNQQHYKTDGFLNTEKTVCFDINEYFGLLTDNSIEDAIKYRASAVPDFLYKFYSLEKDEKIDEKKFSTLEKNCIWIESCYSQNDPYEFSGFYLDKDKLKEHGYSDNAIDNMNQILNITDNRFLLTSFSKRMQDNISMWSYYTNNFHGFCVKFKILNKRAIRNVIYIQDKIPIASAIVNYLKAAIQKDKEGQDFSTTDKKYMTVLLDKYFLKHKSWEHEEEYRFIYPKKQNADVNGMEIPCETAGIKIDTIYAGIYCSDDNVKRLNEIAESLSINSVIITKTNDYHYIIEEHL